MWEIDKDHIKDKDEEGREGVSGETWNDFGGSFDLPKGPKTRFKMYDDDGELYYEGWLHNDDECLNQLAALSYAKRDAGCTTIKVLIEGRWVQEIA